MGYSTDLGSHSSDRVHKPRIADIVVLVPIAPDGL
jgi:hypothetical protein